MMMKRLLLAMCVCVHCNAYTPFLYPYDEYAHTRENHSNSGAWKNFLEYNGRSQYYRHKQYDNSQNPQQDPILQWHKEHNQNKPKDIEAFLPPSLGNKKPLGIPK